MYNDKAQICIGSCSALLSWIAGISITQDIMPIISLIGVCAGTFVALHGSYMIIKKYFMERYKRNTTWF